MHAQLTTKSYDFFPYPNAKIRHYFNIDHKKGVRSTNTLK